MTYPYFNNPYTQVDELLVKPWTKTIKQVIGVEDLDPEVLAPRTLAAQAATSLKATGEVDDFIIATIIDAFLRLRADETKLGRCIQTMQEDPLVFNLAIQYGWREGVIEAVGDTLVGYKETFFGLMEFLDEFGEFYSDYLSAITDLETLIRIILALKEAGDQSLEETIEDLYTAVAGKHSELAAIMLDLLNRLNAAGALLQFFDEYNRDALKGVISELGQTLSGLWQADVDRYLALRDDASDLGRALGHDYGRMLTEVALMILGL